MTEVVVHEMKYYGGKVDADIDVVNYKDEDYNEYRRICCECFRELSIATNLDVYSFYTPEEMSPKKPNIFIRFIGEEMVGAVEISENKIERLFVNPEYQKQGYGKKLLYFAMDILQKAGSDEIKLYVADLNKEAIQLYLNNGFKITNTVIDHWGEGE